MFVCEAIVKAGSGKDRAPLREFRKQVEDDGDLVESLTDDLFA
jgi:hypothetical protein